MIDTHSHILPGLDDGSPDLSHSLRMAEAAAAAGVTTVVCTPHLLEVDISFVGRAREVLQEFRAALDSAGIDLKLLLGFEVDISVAATASDDELKLLTVESGGKLLLVEMPHWGWPSHLRDTIFRLRTAGLTPVLAHPERNDRIQRTPGLLGECLGAGAVAQATAASLERGFGRASKAAFSRQLSLGNIAVLASDAHSHRHASWTVESVVASLSRRLTEEDIDILTRVNPERLLSGMSPLPVSAARVSMWRGLIGGA